MAISDKRGSHLVSKNSTGHSSSLHQAMKQSFTEKKKTLKSQSHGRNTTKQQSAFDNVYNVGHPDKLTKVALQVINRSVWNDDTQSNGSHRSTQKSYLQNLNELVKIHQEMRGGRK